MKKSILLFFYLLCISIIIPSCDDDDDNGSGGGTTENILEVLESNEDYSLLVFAIKEAGLESILTSEAQDLTLFAPSNAAFSAVGIDSAAIESINTDTLASLLSYHVLGSEVKSTNLPEEPSWVTTLGPSGFGESLFSLYVDAGNLTLNGSSPLDTDNLDIDASNGVIHGLDAVLSPQSLEEVLDVTDDLSTLDSVLMVLDLTFDEEEGPYTLFAPDNDAFADLVDDLMDADEETIIGILSNHLIMGVNVNSGDLSDGQEIEMASGLMLTVNIDGDDITLSADGFEDAEVTVADIQGTDGVVHIIDEVIVESDGDMGGNADEDLLSVLKADEDYSLLVFALGATDLDSVIADTTAEFTIFAPDNDAFTDLGLTDSTTIADFDTDTLTSILLYHVLTSKVTSEDLPEDGTYVSTASPISFVDGDTVNASLLINTESLKLNGDIGIEADDIDIMAKNGVIHGIESVLLVPSLADVIGFDDRLEGLGAALDTAGIDLGTLTAPSTLFAPDTAAFNSLGDDLGDVLSQLNSDGDLEGILLTHVVAESNVVSSSVEDGGTADAVSEVTLTFGVSGDNITVSTTESSGTVQIADIQTTDGIIHVIDGVLLPPSQQ
ncbi:fasciclin domain-containing protein [Sediminitomix flava]|uniref:Transforming growth factor-beta-induced protein n=1 Tax=Sediminitomix flava TaxID=379075 RepID=A0A315Z917_SEDFL|nr:fasciclin domain-containing protein [Sediminitomix flava]PWJ40200.1 transforming growth factor-beta-induced protein [Sediminitomix flava]